MAPLRQATATCFYFEKSNICHHRGSAATVVLINPCLFVSRILISCPTRVGSGDQAGTHTQSLITWPVDMSLTRPSQFAQTCLGSEVQLLYYQQTSMRMVRLHSCLLSLRWFIFCFRAKCARTGWNRAVIVCEKHIFMKHSCVIISSLIAIIFGPEHQIQRVAERCTNT